MFLQSPVIPADKPPHCRFRCHKAKPIILAELKLSPQVEDWYYATETFKDQRSSVCLPWEWSIEVFLWTDKKINIEADSPQGVLYWEFKHLRSQHTAYVKSGRGVPKCAARLHTHKSPLVKNTWLPHHGSRPHELKFKFILEINSSKSQDVTLHRM